MAQFGWPCVLKASLHAYQSPADDLVLGYLAVDFSLTDHPTLHVYLSVLVRRTAEGWLITHYQVSRLDRGTTR
ncbi:hypothetical protein [Streptosporangium sp. KLBMP 9127]|nr:hypothetical protein [Streptosporangium sp. KLBMP 9127]